MSDDSSLGGPQRGGTHPASTVFDNTLPVIVAPMAGGPTTPELVAAVLGAGGGGFLAGGYLSAAALGERIATLRGLTARPFGVNLFLPQERPRSGVAEEVAAYRDRLVAAGYSPGEPVFDDDGYPGKRDLLLAEPVAVVSFTFGCPDPATVDAFHQVGTRVAVTVTGREEAVEAGSVGADVLVVQGAEAGGHRALFVDDPAQPDGGPAPGLLVALRSVASVTDLPLVAAGGIMDGAGVAAALAAGAVAAQLGTAFLLCPEAGTRPVHRAALADRSGPGTAFTRSYTGRTARGIRNAFQDGHSSAAPAAYPQVHHLTAPIRAQGDPDASSVWAGQGYPLARQMPASELVGLLAEELRDASARLAARVAV